MSILALLAFGIDRPTAMKHVNRRIVDVVGVLTEQPDIRRAAKYWSVLKTRLKAEGSELPTNCSQLRLKAADGKRRLTDVANTEQLLRIIQSIPSKKAEPFKLWLAQVGRERIEETLDPELIADRLVTTYERAGYTQEWINQRLQAISARKELTDEWKNRGVQQGKEYAILTDGKLRIQKKTGKLCAPVLISRLRRNIPSSRTNKVEQVERDFYIFFALMKCKIDA